MSKKVLILFFHPRFEDSQANKELVSAIKNVDNVTFRDLYEYYPDFHVDVKLEQQLLKEHDIIIWQHPFYWYSCPPLMKQWIDLVLEYGWAYGKDGDQLKGKYFLSAITSGGNFDVYRKGGRNNFTYKELLQPFEQTVNHCLGHYLPPFIVPSALRCSKQELQNYGAFYAELVAGIQNTETPLQEFLKYNYFNDLSSEKWKALFYKQQ
ncbi:NAD(P)H oxidoreductase [Marivirga lumbricoides]|uniref:NAD(P)H oxidoreductase n=1 Tax=Marivirga lumbricoides TaxID=1046115 RepID=A0ABQ1LNQ2_9BACT|nr:NAD(P)H oxidoreductase [Marivirga lumbricoides]